MSPPPATETLQLDIDGPVATLTLSRPDDMNAMSPQMIEELMEMCQWLADRAFDEGARALIVTGAGATFSAGGDINWFKQGVEDDTVDLPLAVRRGADALHQAIADLRRAPFASVAAVNGAAAGAGFSLALACDLRVASEQAAFVVAYGRIGASPDGGMTYFLPRLIGPGHALELVLTDPVLSAADALERGLVTEVVTADELMATARKRADSMAGRAPHYVRMARNLIGQSLDNTIQDHLSLESHGIAASMGTEDLREGVRAFFNREKPDFRGR